MSIIFIRHGEKPKSHADPHLSKLGVERAKRLSQILQNPYISRPDEIIAMKPLGDHSNRPFETVEYLAKELGLEIMIKYTRDQIHKLVESLDTDKNILICWEHTILSEIIQKISGVDINWHEDDYDSVYIWKDNKLLHTKENL